MSRPKSRNRTAPAARPPVPERNGRRISPDAFPGNSETHLTESEWARLVDAVWEKGRVMPDADPAQWRQDTCGAWMRRDQFGHEGSEFAWRIEKIAPGPATGADLLRPFHWRNRYDIASHRAACDITADRTSIPAERHAGPPRNKPS